MRLFNGTIYSINAAALLLGAAGLLSRVLGIFRDRLLASHFGAGRELDLYYAAFQIPDFLMMIFILGAGSAAILPIFQEYVSRNKDEARRLISSLSTIFILVSFICIGAVFFIAPFLMRLVAPGFSDDENGIAATLTRIMLVSTIFFGLSGIFSSVVQSFQRFFAYALAPLFYNLGIIAGIFIFIPIWGIMGLVGGVVLGAMLNFAVLFLAVRDLGFLPHIGISGIRGIWHDGVKKVVALSFPRVLSLSLSQLTGIALISLGSTLSAGSIAVFQLAQNLYFVPIGIFGVSYAVAIFPRLSQAYIARDAKEYFYELYFGIRAILFWIVPSIVLFVVLRAHIVRVALGAGEFSWEDTRLTAAVLGVLALSLFANALITLFMKGFYALENTWMPLSVNIASSLLSIFLAVALVYWIPMDSGAMQTILFFLRISDIADPRVIGLAVGFLSGSLLNVWLLYSGLKKLAARTFGTAEPFPKGSIIKILCASLAAGAVAYVVRVSFSETLPLITFARVLTQGVAAGFLGLTAYFGLLIVLREENMISLWQTMNRKIFHVGNLPTHWDGEFHGK